MANKFKGEVDTTVDGKRYTLRLDINVLAQLEADWGGSAITRINKMEENGGKDASFVDLRHLVHATLVRYHPDASLIDAGDIVSENPGIVGELFEATSPKKVAGEKPVGKLEPESP